MPLSVFGYPLGDVRRAVKTHTPLKALRDSRNRRLYGVAAPLSDEPIFVPPLSIRHGYRPVFGQHPQFRRRHSGKVVAGSWDLAVAPLRESAKTRALRARLIDGVTWEETGIIDVTLEEIAKKGASDGLRTREDIERRYAAIDRMVARIKSEGRFRLRSELAEGFRREMGGVLGHVTRTGEVIRAGGGQHRFAIARILGLPEMPMQLGVIHPEALAAGHLDRLRQSRYSTGT